MAQIQEICLMQLNVCVLGIFWTFSYSLKKPNQMKFVSDKKSQILGTIIVYYQSYLVIAVFICIFRLIFRFLNHQVYNIFYFLLFKTRLTLLLSKNIARKNEFSCKNKSQNSLEKYLIKETIIASKNVDVSKDKKLPESIYKQY